MMASLQECSRKKCAKEDRQLENYIKILRTQTNNNLGATVYSSVQMQNRNICQVEQCKKQVVNDINVAAKINQMRCKDNKKNKKVCELAKRAKAMAKSGGRTLTEKAYTKLSYDALST